MMLMMLMIMLMMIIIIRIIPVSEGLYTYTGLRVVTYLYFKKTTP